MTVFEIITLLVVITAIFGFINIKFLKLPATIGLMLISIVFTNGILLAAKYFPSIGTMAQSFVGEIDFKTVLIDVMLCFLLFAGALHLDIKKLKSLLWPVLSMASLGVIMSMFITGWLVFIVFGWLGIDPPFIQCLLFGAIIAPTDPIATLGILKQVNVPKKLELKIASESLFNDGLGVVAFLTVLGIASTSGGSFSVFDIGTLFVEEVIGGAVLGLVLGYGCYYLMKLIEDYEVEVMLSIALVMGGYVLASKLHFSGPLTVVVAGILIGNKARSEAMEDEVRNYMDKFWELLDLMLNSFLFVLIGFEFINLTLNPIWIYGGLCAIVITLLARFLSILGPVRFFSKKRDFLPHTATIMTWGGLRGGLSLALVLSISESLNRDLWLTVCYTVVLFSIVVQGLTIKPLVKRLILSKIKGLKKSDKE